MSLNIKEKTIYKLSNMGLNIFTIEMPEKYKYIYCIFNSADVNIKRKIVNLDAIKIQINLKNLNEKKLLKLFKDFKCYEEKINKYLKKGNTAYIIFNYLLINQFNKYLKLQKSENLIYYGRKMSIIEKLEFIEPGYFMHKNILQIAESYYTEVIFDSVIFNKFLNKFCFSSKEKWTNDLHNNHMINLYDNFYSKIYVEKNARILQALATISPFKIADNSIFIPRVIYMLILAYLDFSIKSKKIFFDNGKQQIQFIFH